MILSPPYLKTIIKHQTYLSIQHTQKKVSKILNTKHIIIRQITMLLRYSQINLSEARDNFFKNTKAHLAQKDISEALEQFHRKELRRRDVNAAYCYLLNTCVGFPLKRKG